MRQAQPGGATPRPRSGAEAGRTPCPKGGGQEELPHIRGQGQRPRVSDCDSAGTAERSYPTSKVGGGDERSYPALEVRGGSLGGAIPRPRSGGGRQEELPRVGGQGRWLGGATPRWRSGAAAGRRYPTPLSPRPRAAVGRSNPTTEARGGGREDQPHVQGAVAARAQEGLEELSHVEGQEGRR